MRSPSSERGALGRGGRAGGADGRGSAPGTASSGLDRCAVALDRITNACGAAAALALVAACVVVCQMVFVRAVLGASTVWQTEFVLYSVVAATLIGSPYVLARGGHVRVGLLAERAPAGARRALSLVAAGIGLAFCATLAWSGWRYFAEAWAEGWVTESVWAPPLWAVLLPLPLGVGLLTLQYVLEVACVIAGRPGPAAGGPPPR